MTNLKDKIAIVTGASRSSGIGASVCLSLADAGADIFFTHWSNFDENEGNGVERDFPSILCDVITKMGVRCHHIEVDLSDPESPINLLNEVENTLGSPSILVNNATFEAPSDYRSLNTDILTKHYQVNNSGTILLSTEFAKRFERAFGGRKGGRIINLVSGGPDPNNLAYIATKGAIIAITEPLSVGLAPIGITVNSVNPGPTDTGWMDQELKDHFINLFPMGRIGVPADAPNTLSDFILMRIGTLPSGCTFHSYKLCKNEQKKPEISIGPLHLCCKTCKKTIVIYLCKIRLSVRN